MQIHSKTARRIVGAFCRPSVSMYIAISRESSIALLME